MSILSKISSLTYLVQKKHILGIFDFKRNQIARHILIAAFIPNKYPLLPQPVANCQFVS